MTFSGDLSLPTASSMNQTSTPYEGGSSKCGTDLVFTQNEAGQFLSFYWQSAAQYDLCPEQVIGQWMPHAFRPLALSPYQEKLRQVLTNLLPLRFKYPFIVTSHYLIFDITLSPVLMSENAVTMVVATGEFCGATSEAEALHLIHQLESGARAILTKPTPQKLTALLANIRQTLVLEEVWERTVEGFGRGFGVNQCVLYSYQTEAQLLTAVAKYVHPHSVSLIQSELDLADVNVQTALATLQPLIIHSEQNGLEPLPTSLMLATSYQNQPNGLLVLYSSDRSTAWNQFDLTTLQEIADQVGTGIGHALMFQASRNLADELQNVNETLMQQHSDLEEARQHAEAASRLKSEFLANTSHELRTPLNGVIGFLKLIMDDMADDPVEKEQFIQEAYRSAIHLLHVINDILDIAKIEAGKMQLDLNPVKLDELLTEVERITHPLAQEKHLSFEIRTPDTRDEVILYGNYQRLLQVMLNLVGNAIKFTHEGGVTISAEVIDEKIVVQDEEMPGIVKISVADTGIGVSLEKQDQLFQTFNQIDGSRTRQYGGTGLGLAISQKLVETMGGVVNFFSMGEGLGSTVTFTAPLYINPVMVTAPLADSADLLL